MPAVDVPADCRWFDTGIDLVAGARYRLAASGTWHDAGTDAGPSGVEDPVLAQRIAAPLLRYPGERYMTLIGALDREAPFVIGDGCELTVPQGGRLFCYANDVPAMYHNNTGSVTLTVERIG